jgi:hypothetical protein
LRIRRSAALLWEHMHWIDGRHGKARIKDGSVQYRWGVYKNIRAHIDNAEGGMDKFTQAYKHYGINRGEHKGQLGIWYREWAPGAQAIALVGEFNSWEAKDLHWAVKDDFGTFNLFLPDIDGKQQIPHRWDAISLGIYRALCSCSQTVEAVQTSRGAMFRAAQSMNHSARGF